MTNSPSPLEKPPHKVGTALVRYTATDEQPGEPRPLVREEFVIHAPRRRQYSPWIWAGLASMALLVIAAVAWTWWNRGEQAPPAQTGSVASEAELEATVVALVDARLTAEASKAEPTATPVALVAATMVPARATPAETVPQVEPQQVQETPILQAQTTALTNVRSGPGELYEVRGLLPAGAPITVTGRSPDGSWLHVETETVQGWVASWLLALSADQPTMDPGTVALLPAPPTPVPPTATPTATETTVPTPEPQPAEPTPMPVAAPVQPTVPRDADRSDGPPTAGASSTAPAPLSSASPESSLSHRCLVNGNLWLIHPVNTGVHDQVTFRWGFSNTLPEGCGFEVMLWRAGEAPSGVHDAIADHENGVIKRTPQSEYQLTVPYLHNLPGVRARSGDYYWTVGIVQVEPAYQSLGRQAEPAYFYINVPQ